MNIYFSTGGVLPLDFEKSFRYIEPFHGKVGIEIFPEFHVKEYESILKKCMPKLKEIPISCHAPYYESEYSSAIATAPYIRSMELLSKTLEYVKDLNCKYMVFHHNNRPFAPEEKETMLRHAEENFWRIKEICEKAGIPLVIENAGVICQNTMLLNEQEFIDTCLSLPSNVLIDIGHAHANGWDLEHVIEALKDKIVSYHVHNNDGHSDGHRRIFDGTLDFQKFMECCKNFTPNADIVIEYCPEAAAEIADVWKDITYISNMMEAD